MKNVVFGLFLVLISGSAFSGDSKIKMLSTWIDGSEWIYNYGVYGTKYVADINNIPGTRRGSISWTDSAGNLWLFGGIGYDGAGGYGRLNDLWKYDISDNTWTWISGSDTANQGGSYGTKGIAASTNMPGARLNCISWIDSTGDLWLFGGSGYDGVGDGRLNDLWKYDISDNTWTWISGSDTRSQSGSYGTKGIVAPTNIPGARENSISWTDSSGDLWLFGGYGYDGTGKWGGLNDLWKYDVSDSMWTWMSGSDLRNQQGYYGTKGIAASTNRPGARYVSISWTDGAGDLWLFGGVGYDGTGKWGGLNDLWKYDVSDSMWTWMSGSDLRNQQGYYGTKGIAASTNIPGARYESISWTDSTGNLWLMGGDGYDSTGYNYYLNDLWKYNISDNTWTWVSGSKTVEQSGLYGTKGIAASTNIPGARENSISWTDSAGNLWLFGGDGCDGVGVNGYQNDLWKYDIYSDIWTWVSGSDSIYNCVVYGVKNVPDNDNTPGARKDGVSWTDSNGDLWLFGGYNGDDPDELFDFSDLWKYDVSDNVWMWISGSDTTNQIGVYGVQDNAEPNNIPGARDASISWKDSAGDFWLFGGYGYDGMGEIDNLNDLWKYDLSDNMWTWVSGSDTAGQNGSYGIRGIAATTNIPGARGRGISWTDSAGDLWLFGGSGYDSAGEWGYLNDLWKYDISDDMWTWMSGSNRRGQSGSYGTKGIAASINRPGARDLSVSWTDSAGNLWLFGGIGYDGAGGYGRLNDLWKYDVSDNTWIWISGSRLRNEWGSYGTKSIPASTNIPGARYESICWMDASDDLWLFGGIGYDGAGEAGSLNDLWKYNVSDDTWTWVFGSDTYIAEVIYGIQGIPSTMNYPGPRYGNNFWIDSNDELWLYGGEGYDALGRYGTLNDLWKIEFFTGFDLIDYSAFSAAWLSDDTSTENWNQDCDLDSNGVIDMNDLLEFVEHWLE